MKIAKIHSGDSMSHSDAIRRRFPVGSVAICGRVDRRPHRLCYRGKPERRRKAFRDRGVAIQCVYHGAAAAERCDGLLRTGPITKDIEIVRVPGAFEIPSAARTLALTEKYDAIICIGCLLRGDTAHYDVIVNEVTRGIGQSAQETGVPHAFGVLTCETLEQAIDRAGLKMGNKGFEAALAAVEMASLNDGYSASGFRRSEGGRRTSEPRTSAKSRFLLLALRVVGMTSLRRTRRRRTQRSQIILRRIQLRRGLCE